MTNRIRWSLFFSSFVLCWQTSAAIDWPQLALTPVVTGGSQLVHVTHAGDGSGRLFLVEQSGYIRVIESNQVLAVPFLDITNRVFNYLESGLLSVAFPPNYHTKG